MCKYNKTSFSTVKKKIHAYSMHVIQKKMTLTRYSVKNRNSWQAIECGSAEIPLVHNDWKQMLKILNLFAFIYVRIHYPIDNLIMTDFIPLYKIERYTDAKKVDGEA